MTISNVVPWPQALRTRTEPRCASAMACTMGRPRPNPPASRLRVRLGAGEAAEDVAQVVRRDAAARVGHPDDRVAVLQPPADLDAVTRLGVRDGVLQQRVKRHREPVGVADEGRPGDIWRDRAELIGVDQALCPHDSSLLLRQIRVNRIRFSPYRGR
jgi:hypothetical protein